MVDLVLRYNLYLTTVMSFCFSSFLLLFHLGCACVKGAYLTCDCISPGRSRFTSSCRLVLSLPGNQSLAAPQHRLWVGQRLPCVAQHAAKSPKCPPLPYLPPVPPVQSSPAAVRGLPELGAGACGRVCGGSAASPPCLGVQLRSWRVLRTAEEMFASIFLLLQAPSVPLSVEWGFVALPPSLKLGASTTYYCSPPFRASLEALLWESEFLQLFVLVRADLSPSQCLGLIVGPELTSCFVAGVSH